MGPSILQQHIKQSFRMVLLLGGSLLAWKITEDSDSRHEIKRCLLLWSQTLTNLLLLLLLSRFSCATLCNPIDSSPTRLPCPWDSQGKNTGVGCHFLLQCMKAKSESEVAQSCLTRSDPMDCSPPGSSIHGIFQARVLEWGAIAFSVREKQLSSKMRMPKRV